MQGTGFILEATILTTKEAKHAGILAHVTAPSEQPARHPYRELLQSAFLAAVDAVRPEAVLPAHLPPAPEKGSVVLLALGKAARPMAREAERHYLQLGAHVRGVVVSPRTSELPPNDSHLEFFSGSHPVPDGDSLRAGTALLEMAADAQPEDLMVVLLSGGGSSLAVAPDGLSLQALADLHDALLKSGASIDEMNLVRRQLDRVKAGGLAAATQASRVVALALSDVVGDDPRAIASGPTVGEDRGPEQAIEVLSRYGIEIAEVHAALTASMQGERPRPPTPSDPRLARTETRVIASNRIALEAAVQVFEAHGFLTRITADDITGDAREAGRDAAKLVQSSSARGNLAFVSGGETTVTVTGTGRGGRNSTFALAFALALPDGAPVHALIADSDGIDGRGGHAGAFVGPDLFTKIAREEAHRLDLNDDSFAVFERADALYAPGPTGTNVNDLRFILVTEAGDPP